MSVGTIFARTRDSVASSDAADPLPASVLDSVRRNEGSRAGAHSRRNRRAAPRARGIPVVSTGRKRGRLTGGSMAAPSVYQLRLDPAPSLWDLYTIARGRRRLVLTAKGREYKNRAGWQALEQGVREQLAGPLAVEVNLYPADDKRRDGENSIKAICD